MPRESLEVDVVFVGGGPASLAGAIRLAQLARAAGKELSIAVIEKGKQMGSHGLSGAVLDPIALRDLLPDFRKRGAPIEWEITEDRLYFLTARKYFPVPYTPPPLYNHGFFTISLSRFVEWLAAEAEKLGVMIFPGFSAVELLYDADRVVGVRTGDKGVGRNSQPKENFEPGIDVRAGITALGEGPRGTLSKGLIQRFRLDSGRNPQVYSIGIKEIWELPKGRVDRGRVIHTLGFPLDSSTFGGGFLYSLSRDLLSVGLVVGLSYLDPLLDPHQEFQRFKTHPFIASILEGGKMVEYGAKAIPESGYFAVPQLVVDGAALIGDSAGFLNPQRLKGIHLAMKSGMLAAEAFFEALERKDVSRQQMEGYPRRVRESWIQRELYRSRNFHQGFKYGLWGALLNAGLMQVTGGRGFGLFHRLHEEPGFARMRKVEEYYRGRPAGTQPPPFNGKLTFDKLTDVHFSRTAHQEDQPVHLRIHDYSICHERCIREYGNPCQRFCPASVYEMVEMDGQKKLQLNPSNCVHCKTCDIMDPYEIITWVPPEGGDGPGWQHS
ncbi:MAG: electron transfer flavoprotein-ubiquinone oxidoreductase [Acidobacteria bacterium]|nr:electron transfer flavoprotein-ubiquinone oxidoreductase [Acidobacteriota bacterium]